MKVLMVAEKPSIASAISKALGNTDKSRKGIATPVIEFPGSFQGAKCMFKVTATTGHIFNVDFGSGYSDRNRDSEELFAAPIQKMESNPKQHMKEHLRKESIGVDHLVLWLDCDREGENICFEVIDCVKSNISRKNTWRAKFSSLVEKDIREAMNHLGLPNENEAFAVDARQELDLRVGVAFTRFQNKFFQEKYGDLDSGTVTYGPCQTPTLYFCVQRQDEILNFKPEKGYSINLTLNKGPHKYTTSWGRGAVYNMGIANALTALVSEHDAALVTDKSESRNSAKAPLPFNTVSFLKAASTQLGVGPHEAMGVAERLYLRGLLSYPRTESTKCPKNFDFLKTARETPFRAAVDEWVSKGLKPRRDDGTDAGDHPPITPVASAEESMLSSLEWRIYCLVAKQFVAAIGPPLVTLKKSVTVEAGGEIFHMHATSVLDPGYTSVTRSGSQASGSIPDVQKGDLLEIGNVSLSDFMTAPPPLMSESELLGVMEEHGIGTDASMATHINTIVERNYVTIEASRRLKPTKLGQCLIHGYMKIDPELVEPVVRSTVEKLVTQIAKGTAKKDQVVAHSIAEFHAKYKYFRSEIEKMDSLFEASFTTLAASGTLLSRCGKCLRYMNFIKKVPQRLFCATCDDTYALPSCDSVHTFKSKRCPIDGFEILEVTHLNKKKSLLCPLCFNQPPYEVPRKTMDCNTCLHPTCEFAMPSRELFGCYKCEGTMVLTAGQQFEPTATCGLCGVGVKFASSISDIKFTGDCLCGLKTVTITTSEEVLTSVCFECDEGAKGMMKALFVPPPAVRGRYRR